MEKSIQDLIEISQYYGRQKEYTIGGGGNTSYKNDSLIWVKASGYALATITEDGFAKLDREKMQIIASFDYDEDPHVREEQVKDHLMASNADPDFIRRPSVEASLHEMINHPFIVHMHPFLVNSLMCSQQVEKKTYELFGNRVLFIPYVDPGYILYKKIDAELQKYRTNYQEDPELIFLQNHGIFVGAESMDRIRELYDDVFEKIGSQTREKLSETDVPIPSELEDLKERIQSIMGCSNILKCRNNSLIRDYVKDANSIAKVDKPFIPDGIVYCRAFPLVFALEEDTSDHAIREKITAYQREHNCDPRIVLVEGLGMIGIEENEKALDLVLDMFEDAMKISFYSENFGGQYFMGPEQIRFIEDWEVEKYRRQLSTQA